MFLDRFISGYAIGSVANKKNAFKSILLIFYFLNFLL